MSFHETPRNDLRRIVIQSTAMDLHYVLESWSYGRRLFSRQPSGFEGPELVNDWTQLQNPVLSKEYSD